MRAPLALLLALVAADAAGALGPAELAAVACPIGATAFEPTLGVTPGGALFIGAFGAAVTVGSQLVGFDADVRRSLDGCATWEDVSPTYAGQEAPLWSNDPIVHVDPTTGRVFMVDLQAVSLAAVSCSLSFSDDLGELWVALPIGCGQPTGLHDHQNLFTGVPRTAVPLAYPNVVYFCATERVLGAACATSRDGGLAFGPLVPIFATTCSGGLGHGTTAPSGRALVGSAACRVPQVALSDDDGLTWQAVLISTEVLSEEHEVALAVDDAGTAYALWISEAHEPWLATSPDTGITWGAPVRIAAPELNRTALPTLAAGESGHLALAFIGERVAQRGVWDAFLGLIGPGAPPTILRVNDVSDPIAGGNCVHANKWCLVGDFIDVVIDADGRPWAAFADTCRPTACTERGSFGDGFVGTLEAP